MHAAPDEPLTSTAIHDSKVKRAAKSAHYPPKHKKVFFMRQPWSGGGECLRGEHDEMEYGLIVIQKYVFAIVQFQQMQVKTSQSFFPTRTNLKSREVRRDRTYQLIKRPQEQEESDGEEPQTINIFREARSVLNIANIDPVPDRPIGGLDLFRKMEQQAKQKQMENRRHSKRSNKEATQRNLPSNFVNARFKKDRPENEERENQEVVLLKPVTEVAYSSQIRSSLPEETLKAHASYQPNSSCIKSYSKESSLKAASRTEKMQRPATSKPSSYGSTCSRDEWAAEQRKQYQDKSALLNEISYSKPLVQVYGDRYFEYMLRNRFEEDLKPPAFIYQIGHKKFSESRAVETIKKYRPDLRQKEMLFVKGRKVRDQQS